MIQEKPRLHFPRKPNLNPFASHFLRNFPINSMYGIQHSFEFRLNITFKINGLEKIGPSFAIYLSAYWWCANETFELGCSFISARGIHRKRNKSFSSIFVYIAKWLNWSIIPSGLFRWFASTWFLKYYDYASGSLISTCIYQSATRWQLLWLDFWMTNWCAKRTFVAPINRNEASHEDIFNLCTEFGNELVRRNANFATERSIIKI